MVHQMKLWAEPFAMIQSGQKDVELRLHDEKRQQISVGDTICFSCAGKTLTAHVIGKRVFPDFAELYRHYDKLRMGYRENEIPDPRDMEQYYTPADIQKYGVVAIEIRKAEGYASV